MKPRKALGVPGGFMADPYPEVLADMDGAIEG